MSKLKLIYYFFYFYFIYKIFKNHYFSFEIVANKNCSKKLVVLKDSFLPKKKMIWNNFENHVLK